MFWSWEYPSWSKKLCEPLNSWIQKERDRGYDNKADWEEKAKEIFLLKNSDQMQQIFR